MKKYYFLFIGAILCCSSCIDNKNNLEISTKIDWDQFKNDLKFVNENNELPLGYGVFPVSEYQSSGNGSVEEVIKLVELDLSNKAFLFIKEITTKLFSME